MASVLTELESVNYVLSMLSRMPVNSLLAADLTPEATLALAELRYVSRLVQNLGFYFNTERSVKLLKNASNRVPVTDDVSRADNATRGGFRSSWGADIIIRRHPVDGRCLYDKNADSRNADPFDFSNHSEIRVDLVRLLDFDATPDSFRHYVTVRAGRNVQARLIGDPSLYRFSTDDEARALQVLQREELDTSDANALNAPGVRQFTRRRSPLDRMGGF